jgi:hypothetical protein
MGLTLGLIRPRISAHDPESFMQIRVKRKARAFFSIPEI